MRGGGRGGGGGGGQQVTHSPMISAPGGREPAHTHTHTHSKDDITQ